MIKKIVISHFNNIAAILQNNKIEEIVVINTAYQVNDIYIGIVQKVFSSINAAFIKLGKYGKSGFIHISDIKSLKRGRYISNISEMLSINQLILVQVVKEPTINKGPRLTANIHLYGKYIALMPFCNTISISHKIYDDNERIYLNSLAVLIKPEMMGLLIKPSARGIAEKLILQDLEFLKKQWYFIKKTFISTSSPTLIYKDEDLIKRIIRDFYEESVKKIVVDSEDGLRLIYYYLSKWNCILPITKTKLQLYNKPESILDEFNIKLTIQESLKPKVKLLYGGYLIIENYEALTVIDVNSGSFNKSDSSKETILKTNFYAAIEIAYQLRIRNINGVIIADFIDMYSQRDQLQLLEHFNRLLKFDSARPQIVQLSELGLVELTRRRRGQSLQELFSNLNSCNIFLDNINLPINITSFKEYSEKQLLVYKNIRSLFFTKKFKNNVILKFKEFHVIDSKLSVSSKYWRYIDELYTINLFHPKANYIVPFVFYIELMHI